MQDLFTWLLLFCGFLVTGLGLFVVFHIARPQKPPADTSNRINKIRLLWFALTREDLFAVTFPWLKQDELKNINPYK